MIEISGMRDEGEEEEEEEEEDEVGILGKDSFECSCIKYYHLSVSLVVESVVLPPVSLPFSSLPLDIYHFPPLSSNPREQRRRRKSNLPQK
jgi:hypothetical protein